MSAEKEYTEEDIKRAVKPLSDNRFARFFQNILRRWLGVWYGYAEKRPRLAKWIYKIGFFVLFSTSVTVWQFVIMTFLPYAFKSLNTGPAGWPMIPLAAAGGRNFTLFGDENGWGYFIAFEIAVFTAQCINFPLQRNVTYKSHGNAWVQAAWYFIGWVLVSVATNAVWGVLNAFLIHWGSPEILNGLIKTVLTGGVSLVVFFFIFMVIFPDNEKAAARARAKCEKAQGDKKLKAEQKASALEERASKEKAVKEKEQAKSLASSRAIKYLAFSKALEKAEAERERLTAAGAPAQKLAQAESRVTACREKKEKSFKEAVEAVKKSDSLDND